MDEQFNLTPSPALLDLLGKIPFKGWQCIAELIDNSIDAIINNHSKLQDSQKIISVSIPTKAKIEKNSPLVIEDWGMGMNETQLENAVRAGFSDKSTNANLGLFGMGFNVATSRLAYSVNVWSSTVDMDKEVGVCIDLKEMKKKGHFKRPKLEQEKKPNKASGTVVEIFDYKPEAKYLLNRSETKKHLNRAYSEKIFEYYGIKILVNQEEIKPFKFCVWSNERSAKYKYGNIPAIIDIDEKLGEEYFCDNCFSWLGKSVDTSLELECPICNTVGKVNKKDISIRGWVGIQRYTDTEHFGIDISRNGRILSKLDKSFFNWNADGSYDPRLNPEYPRDTPQAGGRIVGQLEANFIIPKYTKDDFEREDKNWRKAVEKVRGPMPLQPELAKQKGFQQSNYSPIGKLFAGYRKVSPPGSKTLIFSKDKLGILKGGKTPPADYITPKNWADKFYLGYPEYQEDTKWWEAVKKADLVLDESTFDPRKPLPAKEKGTKDIAGVDEEKEPEKYPGKKIFLETKTFDIHKLINEEPFTITLIEYYPESDIPQPVIFEPKGINSFNAYLNNFHPLSRDFADDFDDLLLMEIASRYCKLKNMEEWSITRIYYELKSIYAAEKMLSVSMLVNKANELIRKVQNKLTSGEGIMLPRKPSISESDMKGLVKKYLDLEGSGILDPKLLLLKSTYLKYLDLNFVFKFIKDFPELIFDSKIFNLPYSELDDELKQFQLEKYINYFNDVKWFINVLAMEGDSAIKKRKPEIIRNRISIEILYDSLD